MSSNNHEAHEELEENYQDVRGASVAFVCFVVTVFY